MDSRKRSVNDSVATEEKKRRSVAAQAADASAAAPAAAECCWSPTEETPSTNTSLTLQWSESGLDSEGDVQGAKTPDSSPPAMTEVDNKSLKDVETQWTPDSWRVGSETCASDAGVLATKIELSAVSAFSSKAL